MYLTRTFSRWQIELHQRAIHLTRQPDPRCPDCRGSQGGWMSHRLGADWDECACLDQIRTWRLPLWPRPAIDTERTPF
jgi:hypothetical protein